MVVVARVGGDCEWSVVRWWRVEAGERDGVGGGRQGEIESVTDSIVNRWFRLKDRWFRLNVGLRLDFSSHFNSGSHLNTTLYIYHLSSSCLISLTQIY